MKAQSLFYALPIAACILCSAVAAEPGVTANPNKAGDGVQVGVAKRDGVTVSGGEAYVTRNGATEKLSKDLILPSGVVAQPDGTILLKDGTKATLRANQMLNFEGKVMELPADPNENPGGRVAPPAAAGSTNAFPVTGQTNAFGTAASSGTRFQRNNQGAGGSIFLDGGGNPFIGSLGADGSIVTADGRTIAFDGTVRAVTFGANGSPAMGTVNANGTITQADGSVLFADGSVRTADGTVIAAPRDASGNTIRGAIPANTTNLPATTNPTTPTTGPNTNSPNNTGTVNTPNTGNTRNSPNNTGTVNNPGTAQGDANAHGTVNGSSKTGGTNPNAGSSQAGRSNSSPSGARNGGSSGGTGTGSGASGTGGASGGGAPR